MKLEQVREKLKTKDATLQVIADYLIEHCEKEAAFADKILNEKKNLNECMDYIMSEARKLAKNNRACVKREIVFGWAVHYFDEENLEWKKTSGTVSTSKTKKDKPKEQPKPKIKLNKKPQTGAQQLSLFEI
jgi:hypothetical protein